MATRHELERRIEGAVTVGKNMSAGDEKQKTWAIEQMLRILLADQYDSVMGEGDE
jgi:hypothetical protein